MNSRDPIVRFHQLTRHGRSPVRADRSACGTLPTRAVRYCEALTSATAYGWWLFPPIDLELLWDGSDIFWRCDEAPDWMPLLPSAQLPGYATEFDSVAPEALKGCSPPFLTALPEPGTLQLWTGLIAQTAPDWHLLVRAPANLPPIGGVCLFEGIVETDRWFGPLFTNLRLTRTNVPIELNPELPFLQVQPVHRALYGNALEQFEQVPDLKQLRPDEWKAFHQTIVKPNTDPHRRQGQYAVDTRRRRADETTDSPQD